MVEAAIVLEAVVAAQPAYPLPRSGGGMTGGAVHPGDERLRAHASGEGGRLRPGQDVQRTAEAEAARDHAGLGQGLGASGMATQRAGFFDPRVMQGRHQIDEVGLGAAVATRSEEMKHTHAAATLAVPSRFPKGVITPLEAKRDRPYKARLTRSSNGALPCTAG